VTCPPSQPRRCPPIKIYDGQNLETGLRLAAQSFLEAELAVDAPSRRVSVSKLLLWYRDDFGPDPSAAPGAGASERDVLLRLAGLLPAGHPTAAALGALLEGDGAGAPLEVVYREYDWRQNAA
jgi:hypothetical protein